MLGAAAVLTIYRWFARNDEASPAMHAMHVANQLSFSFLAGTNLAAVIVFGRRLVVRDAPLPTQPGHWLLVIGGLGNLTMWLLLGVVLAMRALAAPEQPVRLESGDWVIPYAIACFVSSALSVVATVVPREPLRWKSYFALSALTGALLGGILVFIFLDQLLAVGGLPQTWAAWQLFLCVYPLDQVLGMLILFLALAMDRADSRKRDWVHFVGVVATFLQSAAALAMHYLWQWAALQ
jgi:hypothetical protein